MRKTTVVFGFLVVVVCWSVTSAKAEDCPSGHYYRMSGRCADAPAAGKKLPNGQVLFPNAQGQNVAIKHATTYAQCVRNGHSLGYGDAQIEAYCHQHYTH
jgi:hypothetical protein